MITKNLIEQIFSAATILRWNDHIRPFNFFEIDKQSHKMIIAYIIAKFDEEENNKVDWMKLIEGGIFEFFHRTMLTDLKPEVYHEIMSKKKNELNKWVLNRLNNDIFEINPDLRDRFEQYLFDDSYAKYEKEILAASHEFATKWEFGIIYPWNQMLYGIEKTKETVESCVVKYQNFVGVKKLIMNKKYYGFLDLCGQLRFQQRWAQMVRQPQTTVLGHMFVVAIFAYICSLKIGASPKRCYNNFFSALFHDLPEILTKDIISPIKYSVSGLEDIIKEYEKHEVDNRILPLLPEAWRFEMQYFIENEFSNKILESGKIKTLSEINENFNDDSFSPVDGGIIELCDKLSAYIEASLSINHGIRSDKLKESKINLYEKYANRSYCGINLKEVFDYFKD